MLPGIFHIKYHIEVPCTSAAPISGPFDALIDYSITFDASIKKNEIRKAEKGLRSSMFPVESNERGSDFP